MSLLLAPTPERLTFDLVIGTAVRKPLAVFQPYLESLLAQDLPPGVVPRFDFVLDGEQPEITAYLTEVAKTTAMRVECLQSNGEGFADDHPQTHQWNGTAMGRVGQLKNRILRRAWESKADAVWFVDADLLCDKRTLRSLWMLDTPIACAVYWTRWHNTPGMKAAPQVWLQHPYELKGRGYMDEGEFRQRLLTKLPTQVWGQGACTLIRRSVLEKGIDFSYIPGVTNEGMMAGEDRHFCLKAEMAHIPMVADPWPHIFHMYHVQDRERVPEMRAMLDAVHQGSEWVNLTMRLLEPAPINGGLQHMPPIHWRGRLNSGTMLRDLELQIRNHLDGEPFVAAIHFPSHYPIAPFRGTRRLMEITVVDAKADIDPPVIADEIPNGFDLTTFTQAQQESLRAE